ncbi:MAG: DinB family protein, partial [Syntrophomonadaceae bacterium]
MSEISLLLRMLDESYEKSAWQGPNLRGALRGVGAAEAAWRPAAGRHSIWELVVHAAYWKYAVRRMLTGEKRGAFPEKGSNWFARPVSPTERAWKADLALLDGEHRKLRAAVAATRRSALRRRPRGSKRTVDTLI